MPADPSTPNLRELLATSGWRQFVLLASAWAVGRHGIFAVTGLMPPETWDYWLATSMPASVAILVALAWVFSRSPMAAVPAARGVAYVAIASSIAISAFNAFAAPVWFDDFSADAWSIAAGIWGNLTTLVPLAWVWYYFGRSAWDSARLHEARMARERLESGLVETRLQALQAQVEPHFLFNTLAHVKMLHGHDPARGHEMLDRLIEYLRAALPGIRDATQTLRREIELSRAYLEIQRIRFGSRLAYDIEVEPALLDRPFPPMMLATLVENAIKHGIGPLPEGGRVRIAASSRGERLRLEVSDTGAGLSESLGNGIGISNVRARLDAAFGTRGRLSVAANRPRGVVAAIEIPA